MKKYQPVLFIVVLVLIFILVFRIIKENSIGYTENTSAFKNYQTTFYNHVNKNFYRLLEEGSEGNFGQVYQQETCGRTMSNFEGPQVHLFEFEHDNKVYEVCGYETAAYPEVQTFKLNKFIFDPDSPQSGKPDIEIDIEQPALFHLKEDSYGFSEAIKNFRGKDRTAPYKTFSKKYVRLNEDSSLSTGVLNLDVWLTQFKVIVSCVPHRGAREDDGDSENRAFRYSDFTLRMRVIPNYAPWYTSDSRSYDEKPDIAIGGVYCSGIEYVPEHNKINSEIKRVGYSFELKSNETVSFENKQDIEKLFQNKSIFNKPDTISLYFNNFGTYALRQADKIMYTFTMPIIVKGNWVVKLPPDFYEYITKDAEPFKKSLADKIFPSWGKNSGKFISKIMYIAIAVLVVAAVFPAFIQNVITKILKAPFKAL